MEGRTLARQFHERGVRLEPTYHLHFGGNTGFLNMLERGRLISKKISKTRSVASQLDHDIGADSVQLGPSGCAPWLHDRGRARIRLEGPGAHFMRSPARQYTDHPARRLTEEFITRYGRGSAEPSERRAAAAQD